MKIQGITTLAALGADKNILAGSAFEFVKRPSIVRVWLIGDAGGFLRATVQSGNDVLLEESQLSRANRFPDRNDLPVEDVAAPGDRVKISVRNTDSAAGNKDLWWAVELVEVA